MPCIVLFKSTCWSIVDESICMKNLGDVERLQAYQVYWSISTYFKKTVNSQTAVAITHLRKPLCNSRNMTTHKFASVSFRTNTLAVLHFLPSRIDKHLDHSVQSFRWTVTATWTVNILIRMPSIMYISWYTSGNGRIRIIGFNGGID